MKPKLVVSAVLSFLSFAACADSLPRPNGATFDSGALFTVAGYAVGKPALANFPVLVRIAEDSPAGFSYDDLRSKSTGDDLAFVDMDGNGLPFEIDTWDPNGASLVWVRLPTMTNGAQFAMCWGSETSGKTFCPDNPFADYVGVWHMSEASGTVSDATGHGLGAAPGGATQYSVGVSGKIGGARQNSTAQSGRVYLLVPNYNDRSVGSSFTASGWFNSKGNPSSDIRLFSRKYKYTDNGGWEVLVKDAGKSPKVRGGTNAKQVEGTFSPVLMNNGWQFVTFVFDGTTATTFQNGSQVKSGEIVAATDNGQPLGIGSYGGGTESGSYFIGDMDEARLRPGTVTSDWIAADYATQNDPAFLTPGEAEPYGETAVPRGRVEVVSSAYTNATVSAVVSALGAGATSADVLVEIAASSGFENPAWTTNFAVSAAGTQSFAATGLATGTTYQVRATLANNAGADPFVTRTATFTTLVPGAPAGTAEPGRPGFTTLSAAGTATAFGEGATGATMRLEASTDAGFATIAGASAAVPAAIGQAAALEIANLDPATEYRLRLRLVNDWGLETFVALPATATLDGPIDADDIRWTFSADVSQVDVFLDVTAVYAGATGTATLYCDEDETPTTSRGDRTVAEPGTLAWSALPFEDNALHAKIVLVSEAGGLSYTQTWTAVVDHNFKRLRPQKLDIELDRVDIPTGVSGSVSNPGYAFDDNLSTGVPSHPVAASVIGSLTGSLSDPQNQEAYVSRLEVTHAGGTRYSLYTSADGETWTLVPDATNVQHSGTVSYPVSAAVNYVKCTFESSSGWSNAELLEIEAWGYVKAKAKIVSSYSIASFHNPDGSISVNNNGEPINFGGGDNWGANAGRRLFDGNFTTYWPWPQAKDGAYIVIDFTKNDGSPNHLQEYFVTEIRVGSSGEKKFTLQYSSDGENWLDIPGATGVAYQGTGSFSVEKTAKKVRYIFTEAKYQSFAMSMGFLAEIEVWGIDPNDAPCDHSVLSDWDIGAVPATCTERAKDSQMCLLCGERFTKFSDGATPLGHDYVTTLDQPGRFSRRRDFPNQRRYGSGRITCSRCNFRLEIPTAIDLVTSRVDKVQICGMETENVVQFTDLSVSSSNNPQWGPDPLHLFDKVWDLRQDYPFWMSASPTGQWIDFRFGTEIDLTEVALSVYNRNYLFQFYDLDEQSGVETWIGELAVDRDESSEGARIEEIEMRNPVTKHIAVVPVVKEVHEGYLIVRVPFFETPVGHLRIRVSEDAPDSLWGHTGVKVVEVHPWGTVRGASDYPTEKTTIMILL